MQYLHLLILIATLTSKRVVRRIIRVAEHHVDVSTLDADIIGWLTVMTRCDDHKLITAYARSTFAS